MVMSINCLLLGDYSLRDTFTVNVCDINPIGTAQVNYNVLKIDDLKYLIWDKRNDTFGDFNSDRINLWKVNIALGDIAKLKDVTEKRIKDNFSGEELTPVSYFRQYFQEVDTENIRIIVVFATGPNWGDASSIYEWIRQFTLNRGRNRLVNTYGADFEFLQRDDTINVLWNGLANLGGIVSRFKNRNISDKGLHPIPILAGGPGVGKSRFLDEIEGLLKRNADDSDNEDIRHAFSNLVVINTTYGSGSNADPLDLIGVQTISNKAIINAQASLAIRILFEYFRPQPSIGKFDFSSFRSLCNCSLCNDISLSTALRVVYYDIIKQQNQEITSNPPLVLVLGVDEINKLYDLKKDAFKNLINAIGGIMCNSPGNIFFVPILAGTIEGPFNQYISGSMHQPLPTSITPP